MRVMPFRCAIEPVGQPPAPSAIGAFLLLFAADVNTALLALIAKNGCAQLAKVSQSMQVAST